MDKIQQKYLIRKQLSDLGLSETEIETKIQEFNEKTFSEEQDILEKQYQSRFRISSYFTLLLPLIVIIISGFSIVGCFYRGAYGLFDKYMFYSFQDDNFFYIPSFALIFSFLGIYYFAKIVVSKIKSKFLLLIPVLIITTSFQFIGTKITDRYYEDWQLLEVLFSSIFLYWSIILLRNRYMAVLTSETIEYKNLLNNRGVIYLRNVTVLEQKWNFLSFLRGLSFLNWIKKTGISFEDEHSNEYEIHIFPRVMRGKNYTFDKIIYNARRCNNDKIRQYTV